MATATLLPLERGALRLQLTSAGAPLSWRDVAAGLHADPSLRDALTDALVSAPFPALYWETRPVSPGDVDAPFESVILDAPSLARIRADGGPFAGPLDGARAPAVRTFPNLGGDAVLVVPAPGREPAGYPHLAAFLRTAPPAQVHALWQSVGAAVESWLSTRRTRVWVSTAGLGVSWLHVRLDTRPKYVKWLAYRTVL
ncbi:MAG: hypothetical protein Q8P18_02135 [Pseudomonadota bacterium]|nr:hypothetical protein [Pseudomonadota bacterium]